MERRPMDIKKGAIRPVKRLTWAEACEKLDEAQVGITQMRNAEDRAQYENGWTRFVDSLEEFWTRFYAEGITLSTKFQPWAGAVEAERKNDPLLAYLYQARHQSQHGRMSLTWEEGRVNIAPGFHGIIKRFGAFPDGTFMIDAEQIDPNCRPATLEYDPGNARLPTIENRRHKQSFPAPTSFQGKPLAFRSPAGCAELALAYYRGVLEEAKKRFLS